VKTTVRVAGERPNSPVIRSCTLSASEFEPSNPPPFNRPESSGAKNALEIRSTPQNSRIAHLKRYAKTPTRWNTLTSDDLL
jgi:hypothetical protein